MKYFVKSMGNDLIDNLTKSLSRCWVSRRSYRSIGQLLSLIIDAVVKKNSSSDDPVRKSLIEISGDPIALNDIEISRITFSSEKKPSDLSDANFSNTEISESVFIASKLAKCDFGYSILEGVSFSQALLTNSNFNYSTIIDVDFTESDVNDATFEGVKPSDISIIIGDDKSETGRRRLYGEYALGYLQYNGANTEVKSKTAVLCNHPNFIIVQKILEKLKEQSLRQRRRLQQRGTAQQDVRFAGKFIDCLETNKVLYTPKNRKDLVEVTELGRDILIDFSSSGELPDFICTFLENT